MAEREEKDSSLYTNYTGRPLLAASVIIPVFNDWDRLTHCIGFLENQAFNESFETHFKIVETLKLLAGSSPSRK